MRRLLLILYIFVLIMGTGCVDKTPTVVPTATQLPYPLPEATIDPYPEPQINQVVVQAEFTYTAENHDNITFPARVFPQICGEWAYSPIIVDLPTNGVITGIEVSTVTGYDGYASDVEIALATVDEQSTIWPLGQGHWTGADGGYDDDDDNDWDIDLKDRPLDAFNGALINQEWRFIVHSCGAGTFGTIWWWQITFHYIVGSDLEVLPERLIFYQTEELITSQAIVPAETYSALISDVQEEGEVRVVVTTKDDVAIQSYLDVERVLNSGFAAVVNSQELNVLLNDPNVVSVVRDRKVHIDMNQSAKLMRARDVQALGITGEGVSVGIIDTGIDTDHIDLRDDLKDEKCYTDGACPPNNTNTSNSAEDDNGHGTAVSGIVSAAGIWNNGVPIGIAPDAGLYVCKALDKDGSGWYSDIQACVEWLSQFDLASINLSLGGGGVFNGNCDNVMPSLAQAFINARNKGIVIVAASGNEYSEVGISIPSCMSAVFSVGAVFDAGIGLVDYCDDNTTVADKVICFSNDGDNLDILAPSGQIRTTKMGGGDDPYFNGTSAASPHVAAAVALIKQANPYLKPKDIEQRLIVSGKPITDYRTLRVHPRVDVLAAITEFGLQLTNSGSQTLNITGIWLETMACWLDVDMSPRTILPGEQVYIPVTVNECMADGHYTNKILIHSNDDDTPIMGIPVELYVEGGVIVPTPTPTQGPLPTDTPQPTAIPTCPPGCMRPESYLPLVLDNE